MGSNYTQSGHFGKKRRSWGTRIERDSPILKVPETANDRNMRRKVCYRTTRSWTKQPNSYTCLGSFTPIREIWHNNKILPIRYGALITNPPHLIQLKLY